MATLADARLDVRPGATEEDLGRFSGVLLEVVAWPEAEGQPMWAPGELSTAALPERYSVEEMRLGSLGRTCGGDGGAGEGRVLPA